MFNMQSGAHRLRLPGRGTKRKSNLDKKSSLAFESNTKHTKSVTGLWIDGLNQTIISCSLDGKVKVSPIRYKNIFIGASSDQTLGQFWDFVTGSLVDELDWHPMASVTGLRYSSASELAAFSCDDLSIRVVDIETRKVVREFWGCVGQINDFTFSADGRWIIAASQDSAMRIWDLPTSHLIDAIRLEKPCKALAMSSSGEYLAATIQDELGVTLWTNKTLYKHVPTRQISEKEIKQITAPSVSGEGSHGLLAGAFEEEGVGSTAAGSSAGGRTSGVASGACGRSNMAMMGTGGWVCGGEG